jgi:hypothetical protein
MSDVPPPSILNFKFTILENQRWWMGLDWTAALLPHERPSWSSSTAALEPLPPPISFSLPPSSTVLLPLSVKGKVRSLAVLRLHTRDLQLFFPSQEHLRIKRTATWKWAEPDWGVPVKTSSSGNVSRVGMTLPDPEAASDNHSPASASSTRLPDLLNKGLQRASTFTSQTSVESNKSHSNESDVAPSPDVGEVKKAGTEAEVTDTDGWIYGDNKWEGSSGKGGIGKVNSHIYL